MKMIKPCLLFLGLCILFLSCTTIDLYEKDVAIPGFKWKSSFRPEFTFSIKDTTVPYQLFLVLRHNEKYNYNNIWINLYSQPPGDTLHKAAFELPLATNEKWLATGMDAGDGPARRASGARAAQDAAAPPRMGGDHGP